MYQRLLMAILFGFLAFGSASAQESGAAYQPTLADNPAKPVAQPSKSLRLTGVLISRINRTALVNGRPVREGDRVGGADILAIEQRGIRVLVGARELNIDVGGTFVVEQSSVDIARVSRKPARRGHNQERLAATRSVPSRDSGAPRFDAHRRHAVKSGETLSGIALRYRKNGVTMDQMMIALYQSNPQAFSSNINLLHEGAVLRIPSENELHRKTPALAAAEVARHTNSWQPASHRPVRIADSSRTRQYGPVESGETLSAIASRVLHEGVTMDQMMIALYQSNPQAFSGNINLLHEGAVLRIPGENEPGRRSPETATAEVVRQTKAWQAGFEQHALSLSDNANIMASSDGLADQLP